MLTIYTGHHLEKVTPNIDIELSPLDTPEATIQKATDVFEQSKAKPVIFRTNDILFLDTIRTVAMENDMLNNVTIIHMHEDNTNHWLKFDENGWLNSPCDYNYPLTNISNRFYKAMYEKRRKKN